MNNRSLFILLFCMKVSSLQIPSKPSWAFSSSMHFVPLSPWSHLLSIAVHINLLLVLIEEVWPEVMVWILLGT